MLAEKSQIKYCNMSTCNIALDSSFARRRKTKVRSTVLSCHDVANTDVLNFHEQSQDMQPAGSPERSRSDSPVDVSLSLFDLYEIIKDNDPKSTMFLAEKENIATDDVSSSSFRVTRSNSGVDLFPVDNWDTFTTPHLDVSNMKEGMEALCNMSTQFVSENKKENNFKQKSVIADDLLNITQIFKKKLAICCEKLDIDEFCERNHFVRQDPDTVLLKPIPSPEPEHVDVELSDLETAPESISFTDRLTANKINFGSRPTIVKARASSNKICPSIGPMFTKHNLLNYNRTITNASFDAQKTCVTLQHAPVLKNVNLTAAGAVIRNVSDISDTSSIVQSLDITDLDCITIDPKEFSTAFPNTVFCDPTKDDNISSDVSDMSKHTMRMENCYSFNRMPSEAPYTCTSTDGYLRPNNATTKQVFKINKHSALSKPGLVSGKKNSWQLRDILVGEPHLFPFDDSHPKISNKQEGKISSLPDSTNEISHSTCHESSSYVKNTFDIQKEMELLMLSANSSKPSNIKKKGLAQKSPLSRTLGRMNNNAKNRKIVQEKLLPQSVDTIGCSMYNAGLDMLFGTCDNFDFSYSEEDVEHNTSNVHTDSIKAFKSTDNCLTSIKNDSAHKKKSIKTKQNGLLKTVSTKKRKAIEPQKKHGHKYSNFMKTKVRMRALKTKKSISGTKSKKVLVRNNVKQALQVKIKKSPNIKAPKLTALNQESGGDDACEKSESKREQTKQSKKDRNFINESNDNLGLEELNLVINLNTLSCESKLSPLKKDKSPRNNNSVNNQNRQSFKNKKLSDDVCSVSKDSVHANILQSDFVSRSTLPESDVSIDTSTKLVKSEDTAQDSPNRTSSRLKGKKLCSKFNNEYFTGTKVRCSGNQPIDIIHDMEAMHNISDLKNGILVECRKNPKQIINDPEPEGSLNNLNLKNGMMIESEKTSVPYIDQPDTKGLHKNITDHSIAEKPSKDEVSSELTTPSNSTEIQLTSSSSTSEDKVSANVPELRSYELQSTLLVQHTSNLNHAENDMSTDLPECRVTDELQCAPPTDAVPREGDQNCASVVDKSADNSVIENLTEKERNLENNEVTTNADESSSQDQKKNSNQVVGNLQEVSTEAVVEKNFGSREKTTASKPPSSESEQTRKRKSKVEDKAKGVKQNVEVKTKRVKQNVENKAKGVEQNVEEKTRVVKQNTENDKFHNPLDSSEQTEKVHIKTINSTENILLDPKKPDETETAEEPCATSTNGSTAVTKQKTWRIKPSLNDSVQKLKIAISKKSVDMSVDSPKPLVNNELRNSTNQDVPVADRVLSSEKDKNELKVIDKSINRLSASSKDTSPSKKRSGGNRKPQKFSKEEVVKPFSMGWFREIVHRAIQDKAKKSKSIDVYYFTPEGKKLRSMPEIGKFLSERKLANLTLQNFTFTKEAIYRPPFETERDAFGRNTSVPFNDAVKKSENRNQHPSKVELKLNPKSSVANRNDENKNLNKISDAKTDNKKSDAKADNKKSEVKNDDKKADAKSDNIKSDVKSDSKKTEVKSDKRKEVRKGKSTPTARKSIMQSKSPEPATHVDIDSDVKELRNSVSDKTTIRVLGPFPAKRPRLSSQTIKFQFPRPCSSRCFNGRQQEPSIQCRTCLCLFHPECIAMSDNSTPFTCLLCKISSSITNEESTDFSAAEVVTSLPELSLQPEVDLNVQQTQHLAHLPPPPPLKMAPQRNIIRLSSPDLDYSSLPPPPIISHIAKREPPFIDSFNASSTLRSFASEHSISDSQSPKAITSIILEPVYSKRMVQNVCRSPSINMPVLKSYLTNPSLIGDEHGMYIEPETNALKKMDSIFDKYLTNSESPPFTMGAPLKHSVAPLHQTVHPVNFGMPNVSRPPVSFFMPQGIGVPLNSVVRAISVPRGTLPRFDQLSNVGQQPPIIKCVSVSMCNTLNISPKPATIFSYSKIGHSTSVFRAATIPSVPNIKGSPQTLNLESNSDISEIELTSDSESCKPESVHNSYLNSQKEHHLKSNNTHKKFELIPKRTMSAKVKSSSSSTKGIKYGKNTYSNIGKNSTSTLKKSSSSCDKNSSLTDSKNKNNAEPDHSKKSAEHNNKPVNAQNFNILSLMDSDGCMELIFHHLKLPDLLKAAQVCQPWRTLAKHHTLWENLSFHNIHVLDWVKCSEALKHYSTKVLNLRGLHLGTSYSTWKQFAKIVHKLSGLEHLILDQVPPSIIKAAAENIHLLQFLECNCLTETFKLEDMWKSTCTLRFSNLQHLKMLKTLKIRSAGGITFSDSPSLLRPLSNLKSLSLTTLKSFESSHFNFISSFDGLVSLELGDCDTWIDKNYELLGKLINLEHLRLECGGGLNIPLSRSLTKMKNLKDLILMNFIIPTNLSDAVKVMHNLSVVSLWPNMLKFAPRVNYNTYKVVKNLKNVTYFCWGILSYGDSIPLLPLMKQSSRYAGYEVKDVNYQDLFEELCEMQPDAKVEMKFVSYDFLKEYCTIPS